MGLYGETFRVLSCIHINPITKQQQNWLQSRNVQNVEGNRATNWKSNNDNTARTIKQDFMNQFASKKEQEKLYFQPCPQKPRGQSNGTAIYSIQLVGNSQAPRVGAQTGEYASFNSEDKRRSSGAQLSISTISYL
eukprot:TRINITY_DN15806_c1_g2_i5.p3 TRINITY_DN15806_c1_g2~~TRINITY_DN15806_c1_g2_i5.p3  ORF type:complete len:135 (-),score=6.33 TRINITY_DN15806_c1_g2_i5:531-935(-)